MTDPESGEWISFYSSNTICAYHDVENRLGVFVSERGTSLNGGNFRMWLTNLHDESLVVSMKSVNYYKLDLTQMRTLTITPNQTYPVVDERFKFDSFGDFKTVSTVLEIEGKTEEIELKMLSETHSSYVGAVAACGAPRSVKDFRRGIRKYNREYECYFSRQNCETLRNGNT